MTRRVAIVGASAGLGRALAEEAARAGHSLVLVASDPQDLTPLASDLALRYEVPVDIFPARLGSDPETMSALTTQLWSKWEAIGPADSPIVLLLPVGLSRDEDDGTLDGPGAESILGANFTGIALLLAGLWPRFEGRDSVRVVGFGSIAASRGRSKNVLYAACKRGLESLFESFRHRAVGTGTLVQMYRVGYLATQLTYGKTLKFPVAQPEDLAQRVFRDLDVDFGRRHYPWFWAWITGVLDWVPWTIYRNMKF